MFATGIIAFREFLEAFLIAGVFLGISKKLSLHKEKEIFLALAIGVSLSLLLACATYIFGEEAKVILNEENAEILESYLLIFSGLFIAYVVFSLHEVLSRGRGRKLLEAHKRLEEKRFDISVFGTIIFLILREGFEIALFTASVSLFASFIQNMFGLLLGFAGAGIVGISTFIAYLRFPIHKVFKVTEYLIILLGASLFQKGFTELMKIYMNLDISYVLSLPMSFLPSSKSLVGGVLESFFGIDHEFSILKLLLMIGYIATVYLLFIKPPLRTRKN